MSDNAVVHVTTTDDYDAACKDNDKVVVDFAAAWCGPCRRVAPKVEALAGERTDIKFLKVDVDELADVAAKEGIRAMPTFVFYKGGERVGDMTGADIDKVQAKITELLD